MELFLEFVGLQWHWFAVLLLLMASLFWYENATGPQTISIHQLGSLLNQQHAQLVDLRPAQEFREGHIAQAENIPYQQWVKRAKEFVNASGPVILVCKYGQHAGGAGKELKKVGGSMEQVYRLKGGMHEWTAERLPVIKGAS